MTKHLLIQDRVELRTVTILAEPFDSMNRFFWIFFITQNQTTSTIMFMNDFSLYVVFRFYKYLFNSQNICIFLCSFLHLLLKDFHFPKFHFSFVTSWFLQFEFRLPFPNFYLPTLITRFLLSNFYIAILLRSIFSDLYILILSICGVIEIVK